MSDNKNTGTLFFAPEGKKHGDFFIVEKDGVLYDFFLENEKQGAALVDGLSNGNRISLACSPDGLFWEYDQELLHVGEPGSWNDKSLWAMQIFEDNGKYKMMHSAIASSGKHGMHHPTQQFGLLQSSDLIHWEDCGSPVITNNDTGDYYYPKTMHRFCWRDANIHKIDGVYYVILSAKDISVAREKSGCVGLLKSEDLFSWIPEKPLFSPRRYREVETPHVYEIDGRYVLIYGENEGAMSMRFAFADRFFGEYVEPELNVLNPAQCYAGIFFKRKGVWYFYHWIMDRNQGKYERYLCPPKVIEIRDDFVFLKKDPRYDSYFEESDFDIELLSEKRFVVRRPIGDEMQFRVRSKDDNYSHNLFLTQTKHGLSVRDFTANDRFIESRTIPIFDCSLVEFFFEGKFMEVYVDGVFVYTKVLEFDLNRLESVEFD